MIITKWHNYFQINQKLILIFNVFIGIIDNRLTNFIKSLKNLLAINSISLYFYSVCLKLISYAISLKLIEIKRFKNIFIIISRYNYNSIKELIK